MKLVIAEKPSVGREIASLLGATEKNDGFLAGNGYLVTWAIGHLVTLAMPADYGITGFEQQSLPILPNPFKLVIRKIKKGTEMISDPGALRQVKVIEQLGKRCTSIIVATDAGREGELIFRYLYEYLNWSKPFERLWISSLTEKAIRSGFENLKQGKEYDSLYAAARCRSRADWLIGINATQAFSIAAGNGIYSLGRVQTPTLALICKRYLENTSFSVEQYWQIELGHRKEFLNFKSISTNRWASKTLALDTLKSIQRSALAHVADVKIKTVVEQPPLLYNLTALQKEANKKLNFSAEQTLSIAQSLYEKKFISYPRTGNQYIPEDMWPEIINLVRVLDGVATFKTATSKMKWGRFNKRIVSDVKVTDHYGILITEKVPSALTANENAIYDMIAIRMLEALSQPCCKEVTDIKLQVLHYDFAIKGCKIVEPGWRQMKGIFTDDSTEPLQELPDLSKGDEIKISKATILEKKTKPPALYTEAGILTAMENAGKKIQQEDERKVLEGIGIGTPATRAAIIEILLNRNYIKREKKSLIPTEKGLQAYQIVKDKKISDVALTAEWELALHKIECKDADADTFQNEIESFAGSITRELLAISLPGETLPDLKCPKCEKEKLHIGDKIVKCVGQSCDWSQFRTICGITLSIHDIECLINNGRTQLLKGMKSKSGKKFNACLIVDKDSKTVFEFDTSKK